MCNTWEHPSDKTREISPQIMDKIPSGQHRINLTGGEPALRDDLLDIVDVLCTKTNRLEISTNGYFTKKLVEIGKKHPEVTFRISLEGLPQLNDKVRGIKNGFDHALKTVLSLLDVGVKDVGFGMVVTDNNAQELLPLYHLCSRLGVEFATSTVHNSFYFHKFDNKINDLAFVEGKMEEFIAALLQSQRANYKLRIKDYGRAFINLGILRHMQGHTRRLPCGAATDLFFLDPFGKILACNGSPDPWVLGDLTIEPFSKIWESPQAQEIRKKVKVCNQGCWMVGTAVPAMRKTPWVPLAWILKNKSRLTRGKQLDLK
jgi:MoaA/NifB/PqqE/SkfB family radical SAM enzyme